MGPAHWLLAIILFAGPGSFEGPVPVRTLGGPRLMVTSPEEEPYSVALQGLDLQIRIFGFLAETTMTMRFFNPSARVLEGEFLVPLPAGAAVSGYGLDVDGALRDGVIVEKDVARVAFDREVRKGVDPGLVEWVGENLFRTRVFPIPAEGTRTIKISYVHPLGYQNERLEYKLPLGGYGRVEEMGLEVEVFGALERPQIRAGAFPALSFQRAGAAHRVSAKAGRIRYKDQLVVTVPTGHGPPLLVEQQANGEFVFAAALDPGMVASWRRRLQPRELVIYWDVSGSGQGENREPALALLTALFDRWRHLENIHLVTFSDIQMPAKSFSISKGFQPETLFQFLAELTYDGGTNLHGIHALDGVDVDLVLLFSNGLDTMNEPYYPQFDQPVFAFNTAALSDAGLLNTIARESGGASFNLFETPVRHILKRMFRKQLQILNTRFDGDVLAEVYPVEDAHLGEWLILTGKIKAEGAQPMTVSYGFGPKSKRTSRFILDTVNALQTNLVAPYWAHQKLRLLNPFPDANREEIIRLGKEYGVVTPWTTLLVMETLEQYVEYQIEPPQNLPEMRAAYQVAIHKNGDQFEAAVADYGDHLLEGWLDLRQIHSKNYRLPEPGSLASPDRTLPGDSTSDASTSDASTSDSTTSDASTSDASTSDASTSDATTEPDEFEPELEHKMETAEIESQNHEAPEPAPKMVYYRADIQSRIEGIVRDSIGEAVPGVTVTIRASDGQERSLVTDIHGSYRSPPLAPNTYRITAYMPGLKSEFEEHSLPLGYSLRLDIELTVEEVSEALVVAALPRPESEITEGSVVVAPWDPQTPYLTKLNEASPDQYYSLYLQLRGAFGANPAFYTDCARFFFQKNLLELGKRILSNTLEMAIDDYQLLKMTANLYLEYGYYAQAERLFEKGIVLRPEFPQTKRDLALLLTYQAELAMGHQRPEEAGSALLDALTLLAEVIREPWGDLPKPFAVHYLQDDRFEGISTIALEEFNWVLQKLRQIPQFKNTPVPEIDSALLSPVEADIRVTVSWDDPTADVDLWVYEPSGALVDWKHTRSAIGGYFSVDLTAGLGPESYSLKKAMPGPYIVGVHYFGSDSWGTIGPATCQLTVFTNFGRPNETKTVHTVRLQNQDDTIEVAAVNWTEEQIQPVP